MSDTRVVPQRARCSGALRRRLAWAGLAIACLVCAGGAAPGFATAIRSSRTDVPARQEPLTADSRSPVKHDTEVMALVAHAGRMFAATDQWEYGGPGASGQVLVKDAATRPWRVFERTQSLRVQALDSFPVPRDQGLGPGHALLITQAITGGRSRLQWLLDRGPAFTARDSYVLPSPTDDVRAFGAHESGGVWAVYAGVAPTGVLRGTWSPTRRTLVFSRRPELTVAPPGSPGLKTQKVTGFADCGALYVSIDTKLFRRNDGALPPGVARWVLVYQAPPVGPHNSGLRGLTCTMHHGSPSLLLSTEGNGRVYRLDHLPRGRLTRPSSLVPHLEFSPIPAIRRLLAAEGTNVPASGAGAVHYVIAAYNNFATLTIGGVRRQLFGLEWSYAGSCPATRTCQPSKHFDGAACFAVRTDLAETPTYAMRCLSGLALRPGGAITTPVRAGQAFVSIRTVAASPFGDGRIYYGGYDCNFYPADGTAWIATTTAQLTGLDNRR
jgi:hypothetical protein